VGEVEGLIGIRNGSSNLVLGTCLALGDLGLNCWPGLALSSITEQVHDDCTLGDGLINLEKVLAWHPTILLSILP